jgi:hypothetical protein
VKLLAFLLAAVALHAQVFLGRGVSMGGSGLAFCNVAGNQSTDDTATIQACINNAPDDSQIVFRSGARMKITSTINIHNRYGLLLVGQMGRFGGPSAGTPAPTFYWYGADGGKMFDLDRADNIIIRSLVFFNSTGYVGGTGGANILINVDQTLSPPGTTTADQFEKISLISGTANPNFQGILFSQTSTVNVEAMTVRDSFISCGYGASVGSGIVIGTGGHFNAKKHVYENNSITNCAVGINLNAGGSADILYNKFNTNTTHIGAFPIDPIQITGNDSENCTQFFLGALTSPILMTDNRIAAVTPPMGQAAVWVLGGGSAQLTFIGNKFDSGAYMPVGFAANVGGSLNSSGNTYPDTTNTLLGFYTVPYNLTSQNDAASGTFTYLSSSSAGATNHIGGLNYDGYSQRWQLSNEVSGATVSDVLSEPASGLTFSNAGQGTCATGTDLTSNITGRQLTSASTTFSSSDAGGFVAISGGTGFTAATYFILSASGHNLNTIQTTGSSGTGGTFVLNRGRTVMVQGGSGVADTLWVCAKTISDTYAWKQVF